MAAAYFLSISFATSTPSTLYSGVAADTANKDGLSALHMAALNGHLGKFYSVIGRVGNRNVRVSDLVYAYIVLRTL